jgi:hypothetical protein
MDRDEIFRSFREGGKEGQNFAPADHPHVMAIIPEILKRAGFFLAASLGLGVAGIGVYNHVKNNQIGVVIPEQAQRELKNLGVAGYLSSNHVNPEDKERVLFGVSFTKDQGKTLIAQNVPITVGMLQDIEKFAKGQIAPEELEKIIIESWIKMEGVIKARNANADEALREAGEQPTGSPKTGVQISSSTIGKKAPVKVAPAEGSVEWKSEWKR